MYLVIRIIIPFVFNNKREAMEFIDNEIKSSLLIDTDFSLWYIHGESLNPLDINIVRKNLERGWHE